MKKAVILFNLGGPDKLENVEPFLFNLFYDPAILNLPKFLRYPLAKLISNRRTPTAKKIYEELGGASPILKLTIDQSNSLENKLNDEDQNNELRAIEFPRIAGGKPFQIDEPWFNELLEQIGQAKGARLDVDH